MTWMRVGGARPILGCFHNRMRAKELKRWLSSQSQVFSGLDESKAERPTLKPILGCLHDLDESQECSTYPRLFSQPDEILGCLHDLDESRECSTYPRLFSQPDESKRAEKCLSSQSQVFLGLDESKVERPTLKPILGCFHDLDESQTKLVLSQVILHQMKQPDWYSINARQDLQQKASLVGVTKLRGTWI
jgi:hypothetical protein